jgi:putative SOS response-associated peptidase YedK
MKRRYNAGPQDEIAQLFYKAFIEPLEPGNEFKEHYVAVGKGKPTLTGLINENGNLKFQNMRWTLPYSYFDKKTNSTITRELQNSMSERVFFQHKDQIFTKRCIIIIDGYFEYYHLNKETYPYYLYPANGGVFYAAGIWDASVDEKTGEITDSFSIMTTIPNELTAKIHNNPQAPNGPRMLVLIKPEEALNYLDSSLKTDQIKQFFKPYNQNEMKAHTVLRFQRKENAQFLNTPSITELYEYPELVA